MIKEQNKQKDFLSGLYTSKIGGFLKIFTGDLLTIRDKNLKKNDLEDNLEPIMDKLDHTLNLERNGPNLQNNKSPGKPLSYSESLGRSLSYSRPGSRFGLFENCFM